MGPWMPILHAGHSDRKRGGSQTSALIPERCRVSREHLSVLCREICPTRHQLRFWIQYLRADLSGFIWRREAQRIQGRFFGARTKGRRAPRESKPDQPSRRPEMVSSGTPEVRFV